MSDSSPVSLRVQIYEDDDELRNMLSMLLTHSSGFELCGAYSNCAEVIANFTTHNPDVILCDIEMPGVDGIEGVRLIRSKNKEVLILMYTVFDDNEHLFEALCEGANGYLLKGDSPADLLSAIREVFEGGAPMSPGIAKKVIQAFALHYKDRKQNQILPYGKKKFSL
jgi:DNA-binding NarL/FixJ family response regulator